MRRLFLSLSLSAAFAAVGLCQTPSGYVDLYVVKVKPEKRAEFDAAAKKIASANHTFKGVTWLAYETTYGEANTVTFASVRQSYGEIEKSMDLFMGALKEGYGPTSMKIFQDMNNCALSARGELRRRRPELSWNLPADQAGYMKHIGEARWMRIFAVRVKPAKGAEYPERVLKPLKAALEKSGSGRPTFISSMAEGGPGTFYFTNFYKSLSEMDEVLGDGTSLRSLMGNDGYQQYMRAANELSAAAETTMARLLPELSNPPEEIASAAPDFWRPKPAAAPKPKAKPAAPGAGKTGN